MNGAYTGSPWAAGNGTPGMPPYDPELERSVLGAPLLVPEVTPQIVSTGLAPVHFFNRTHRTVFGATLGVHHRGDPVSLVTLRRELEGAGTQRLDDLPVSSYLTGLMASTGDALAAPAHAEHIIEDYQRRRLLDASRLMYRGAITGKRPQTVITRVMGAVQSIIELPAETRAAASVEYGARDLYLKEVIPVPQYVAGLFPEGLTLLVGPPKIGKSMLILSVCRAQALGGVALGKLDCLPARVLYLCLEDGETRTANRWQTLINQQSQALGLQLPLDAPGIVPDNAQVTFKFDCPPLDQGGMEYLSRYLAANAGPSGSEQRVAIYIDTLTRIRPDEGDAFRSVSPYTRDYRFVAGLVDLIRPYACELVASHHDNKGTTGSGDFLDKVSGTKGLTAAADNVVYLSHRLGGDGVVMDVRGRDLEGGTHRLSWDARLFSWMLDDDPEPVTPAGASPLSPSLTRALAAANALVEREGAFTARELAVSLGMGSRGGAANLLADLERAGLVERIGQGPSSRWQLSGAGAARFGDDDDDDDDDDD
jgi:hypothetical protein